VRWFGGHLQICDKRFVGLDFEFPCLHGTAAGGQFEVVTCIEHGVLPWPCRWIMLAREAFDFAKPGRVGVRLLKMPKEAWRALTGRREGECVGLRRGRHLDAYVNGERLRRNLLHLYHNRFLAWCCLVSASRCATSTKPHCILQPRIRHHNCKTA
jgi:hypothetical protein